jgi:EEF1A lysine methyltransferase 1
MTFKVKENPDFNQYWYSKKTIEAFCEEIESFEGKIAFLSTPSLFFSCKNPVENKVLFDFDENLNKPQINFVKYDFNESPESLPEIYRNSFDVVVVDPPFITESVWRKYKETVDFLLIKDGGKFIGTTIQENADLMKGLFNAQMTEFLPSIPNLVYQYGLYVNYTLSNKSPFNEINKELA